MSADATSPDAVSPSTAPAIEEGQLRARDGTRLFFRHAAAAGDRPRARLLVVHGFAEHSGRYRHVLANLARRGFDVWALDLRGYGQSDGARGLVSSYDDYLDDVQALVAHAAPDRGTFPLFLLGHSMGGLVATRFAQERPSGLRGLLLSSPFYRVKMPVPAVKRFAANVLSRVWPSLALATDLNTTGLSRDPAVGEAYRRDPLVLTKATTRWFTSTMKAQREAMAAAPSLRMPVLLVHGAADPVVDPEASRELFERLGAADKTLRLWPELRHEILNEPEQVEVMDLMAEWIGRQLTPGT